LFMKIAQVAPIIERVPPKKYGGTERVIHALTEQLVALGHEVTLFASGDSQTSAKLVSVVPRALREQKVKNLYGANAFNLLNIGLAYKMQSQFDIIHDHNNDLSLPVANIAKTPVVLTLHGAFNGQVRPIFEALDNVNLVSISNSQRKGMPNLNYAATVYNGLDMEDYPFSNQPENYLLYVGRISVEKGVDHAIHTAVKLGIKLIIAAKLETESDEDMKFYHRVVRPLLRKHRKLIKWVGEVDEKERNKLMSKALCFLHPGKWEEPFGLTLIESMACGTPVVAFKRGSIPEVIEHKKSGFVITQEAEMVASVKKIAKISRAYCRNYALQKFSSKNMAEGYLAVYEKAIRKLRVESTPMQREIIIPSRYQSYPRSGSLWLSPQTAKKVA
jgi:glycosyltransferase involved in cell wall biosynthesis